MTPIFWRIWLMKIMHVFVLAMVGLRMRSAWLMSRACRPTCESPISPSTSLRGTRAATESMTMMSTAFDLTSISAIFSASSPLDGWLTSRLSRSTPMRLAQLGSRACSASMNAATPPCLLGVGDGVQGDGRLAARFRAEDLDDAAARQAPAAQGDVEAQRAGRDALRRRQRSSRPAA